MPSVCVCSDISVRVLPNTVQENLYFIVLEEPCEHFFPRKIVTQAEHENFRN